MQSLVGAGEGMLTTISEVVREGPCSSQEPCPHRAVCYLLFQFFSSVSTQHYHKVPDEGLWSFQPVAALWIQENISDDSQLKEQPAQIFQFVEILVGIRHSEVKPFVWWGCNSHILLVAMPGPLATSWFFIVLCFLVMVFITASFGWALTTCQVLHMRLVATTILKRGHITLILKMKEPHSIRVSNLSMKQGLQFIEETGELMVFPLTFCHITLLFGREWYCHYQNGLHILSHICHLFIEEYFGTKTLKPRPLLKIFWFNRSGLVLRKSF